MKSLFAMVPLVPFLLGVTLAAEESCDRGDKPARAPALLQHTRDGTRHGGADPQGRGVDVEENEPVVRQEGGQELVQDRRRSLPHVQYG